MENRNFSETGSNLSDKTISYRYRKAKDYKIYTPEMTQKYKDSFKRILKFTNDKSKTKLIMYNKALNGMKMKNF